MIEYSNGWLPIIIMLIGIILNLAFDVWLREKARDLLVTVTALVLIAGAFTAVIGNGSEHSKLFYFGNFYMVFTIIGMLSSLLIVFMAQKEFRFEIDLGVFFTLLLLANIGGVVIASSRNFIPLYIGYELVSISSYAMVAFKKRSRSSAESAMKIFLLGALSSAFIIYGLSMYYGATGTFQMNASALPSSDGLKVAAIALIAAGSGFKIGLVPFHVWIPDIYTGAQSTVVTFLAASSKKMAFAFVIQLFLVGMVGWSDTWSMLFAVLAALSVLLGNFAAVVKSSVMRILAYSTIAQAGYIVIGIAAYGASLGAQETAMTGIIIHIIAHVMMKGGSIMVVFIIIDNYGNSNIENFRGLLHRKPLLASIFSIFLFSLMGIPPTMGFVGKFFLFFAAVEANMIWLAILGVIGSAVSIYYYGRIIRIMAEPVEENETHPELKVYKPLEILLLLMSIFVLILGFFAQYFVDIAVKIIAEFPTA